MSSYHDDGLTRPTEMTKKASLGVCELNALRSATTRPTCTPTEWKIVETGEAGETAAQASHSSSGLNINQS